MIHKLLPASRLGRYRRWLPLAALVAALLYPQAASSYFLSLAIEVLIFAIFAMSLDLLLGYTGLPSFGHAAFLGLGAYLTAFLASRSELALNLSSNLLVTLPLVLLSVAGVALVVGLFSLRTSGLYFLMITLAFAQMLFSIAISWSSVTGGSDGLSGVARPTLGVGPVSYVFESRQSFYYLTLILFGLCWAMLRHLVRSPFGLALQGIRENEPRMRALGYNTLRFKISAFVVAGMVAAVAGLLLSYFFRFAAPDTLYWTMSGQALIMVIIGGAGTLSGPIFGALLVRLLPQLVSSYTDRWQTLVGLVFILFVMFAPQGLLGLRRERAEREAQ